MEVDAFFFFSGDGSSGNDQPFIVAQHEGTRWEFPYSWIWPGIRWIRNTGRDSAPHIEWRTAQGSTFWGLRFTFHWLIFLGHILWCIFLFRSFVHNFWFKIFGSNFPFNYFVHSSCFIKLFIFCSHSCVPLGSHSSRGTGVGSGVQVKLLSLNWGG